MEAGRVYNFNPGPGMLPLEVLKEAQAEFLNFNHTGESILEISHRAPEYAAVQAKVKADVKELMGLGDDYEVLFCPGGGSQAFAMIPLNYATKEHPGDYILSGSFAEKAYKEAAHLGVGEIAASSKETGYHHVPQQDELNIDEKNASYLYLCNNNTIYGTEFHYVPKTNLPLIADMSSDFLSRPWDYNKYAFMYGGVQKNLGPAGVVLVVARKSLLENSPEALPTMFKYSTFYKKDSTYNTPPVFNIYMVGKVVNWIKEQGGLEEMARRNKIKSSYLYDAIDRSDGFYAGHADKVSRSFMNVTFRLPNEDLEKKFIAEAKEQGLCGVKGHRSVGGMRASIYNAMPIEGAEKLASFMDAFRKANA